KCSVSRRVVQRVQPRIFHRHKHDRSLRRRRKTDPELRLCQQFGARPGARARPEVAFLIRQKTSFNANCPILGSRAPRMEPNPAPLIELVGLFRFTRLDALKNSARNCRLRRSLKANRLEMPISEFSIPGPRNVPLEMVPQVPNCGRANAVGTRKSTQGALLPH